MNTKSLFTGLTEAFRAALARRNGNEFVCGDCTRNAQCGSEPSDQCIVRAAQIASDRKRPPKRSSYIGW